MANAVTSHKFVSGKADGADTTLVRPSNWNADHNFSGGSDGQILQRDSTQTDGASWIALPVSAISGTAAAIQVNSTTVLQLNAGVIPQRVGGTWQMTMSAAVTIANTGLTANTLYYVYAFDNAGTRTLELSTTGHSTDATFGVEIKTGDATRTLVGAIRAGAGTPGTFVDAGSQRFAISWFNRKPKSGSNSFTANRSTISASYVELNSEIRVEFLTWGDSDVFVGASGGCTVGGGTGYLGFGFDGATPEPVNVAVSTLTTSPFGMTHLARISEGYHYATLLGLNSPGGGANNVVVLGGSTALTSYLKVGING